MVSHLGGGLLPEVEREFRRSPEWNQFDDELLKVAEEIAKDDQPSEPEEIDSNGTSRRLTIDRFIKEVFQKTRKQITRKDIWTVAGYQDPTEFERFQRNDARATSSATFAFNRVLSMPPEDFIRSLEKISAQK